MYVTVNQVQIASGLCRNAVKVFQFPDVVGAHPAVLPGDGISVHSGLIVAAQQALHIESREIARLFIRQQQRAMDRLLPAGNPWGKRVFHEFQRLLLDIGEA